MILQNIDMTSVGEFKYWAPNKLEELQDLLYLISENEERNDMPISYDDTLKELNYLREENKRLKSQLKELREKLKVYEEKEKAHEKALENSIEATNSIDDNIEEKISDVCSRTLCSQREALDILSQNDYNVDKAITLINWSKLNVPTVIL